MLWDDTGFLISKSRYNENSIISELFTKNHGKVSGIIFGGTSKKIKNYLQIGNKLHINFNSKSDNRIGYLKVEISKALSPNFFEDYQKLSCITAVMNLLKILTAEFQKNEKIFFMLEEFYNILNTKNWIKNYIFWELELYKNLGYDLKFKDIVHKEIDNDKIKYISKSSTEKRIIPNFLIDRNDNCEDLKVLLDALKILSDYLEKTILKPNNFNQPLSRKNFINTLR